MGLDSQADVDARNVAFWDELCGSALARSLGIDAVDARALARFDDAYMAYYPYLAHYLEQLPVDGKDVLEIGLGFGTVGSILAQRGAAYHGLDLSETPVRMMRERLSWAGSGDSDRVRQGSALKVPWDAGSFDVVVSIGCLHHTGNLQKSIDEVLRVLRPEGLAFVMLYNKHSLRRLVIRGRERVKALLSTNIAASAERLRARYDANAAGEAAPHTDYVSRAEAARLFSAFARVSIDIQNIDAYQIAFPRPLRRFGTVAIRREALLGNVGRVLGLDLYIHARK